MTLSAPLIQSKLPGVRPILEQWVRVCDRYEAETKDDRVCWYHERAHTGFLAAAAWLAGGVALEEWRTEKKNREGQPRKGRGDLWLSRKSLRLHIEAKHAWIGLRNDPDAALRKVEAKLAEAQRAAREMARISRDELRVGALFAAPVVRRADAAHAEGLLVEWAKNLSRLNCLALAIRSYPTEIHRKGSDNLVPGIALLIAAQA